MKFRHLLARGAVAVALAASIGAACAAESESSRGATNDLFPRASPARVLALLGARKARFCSVRAYAERGGVKTPSRVA